MKLRYKSYLMMSCFLFVNVAAGQSTSAISSISRQANSLHLNGIDQDVHFPQTAENFVNTDWTMELWIKPDTLYNDWQALMAEGHDGARRGPSLWIYDTRIELWFSSESTGDQAQAYGNDSTLTQNEWQHVAGTYDGDTLRIFINAVQDTAVGLSVIPDTVDGDWFIGQRSDNDFFYTGYMDEVRIWNYALSAEQIAENMNNALTSVGNTGLVGSYGFNQETVDGMEVEVKDQSSYGIVGTAQGESLVDSDTPVSNTVKIGVRNEDQSLQPTSTFALADNYPNPFSQSTQIGFTMGSPNLVKVEIFDLLGRRVMHFSESYGTGNHTFNIDGSSLVNGLYLYRLTAGGTTESRKMVVLH